MLFHKGMAIFGLLLLLSHPVLLAAGHRSLYLFSFKTGWKVNLGQAALVLLVLTVLFALVFRKLRLDYRVWRVFHKGAILVVVLGFVHGLTIGHDLRHAGMRVYWWLLFAMAVALFLYRNLFVPFWGRRRLRVSSVTPETHNTWTLRLESEAGEQFRYSPGQFMFLKLLRKGLAAEEHPFTISSSPTRPDAITATIKESGDYTRTIGKTRPGDTALVEAPFGRFSLVHHDAKSFLFIAGGVGITPIMSMLRYLRDTGDKRPATLIYANRAERDIIFREELEALPDHVRVVHVLSGPEDDWTGPRGYVTADLLQKHVAGVLKDADVFFCGPPPMMRLVIGYLRTLGVPGRRIHYERFAI